MNNVAWSIHVQILSGHMFSFLLGDTVMLCLTFEDLFDFPNVAAPFYIPTNSV